jgi:hypothetical protein
VDTFADTALLRPRGEDALFFDTGSPVDLAALVRYVK